MKRLKFTFWVITVITTTLFLTPLSSSHSTDNLLLKYTESKFTFSGFYDFLTQYGNSTEIERPIIIDDYISWQETERTTTTSKIQENTRFPAFSVLLPLLILIYSCKRNLEQD